MATKARNLMKIIWNYGCENETIYIVDPKTGAITRSDEKRNFNVNSFESEKNQLHKDEIASSPRTHADII